MRSASSKSVTWLLLEFYYTQSYYNYWYNAQETGNEQNASMLI